ncbi:MAG: GH116 family glycosyl hydrolase [bacterium]|nr:GH116 family glycosyl hydrolase [bacterium]
MRRTDFLHNTLPNGYMTFRTLIPLGEHWWQFKACADGQMGTVIKASREWKLSGDNGFLRELWPKVKAALEFAWKGCGSPPPQGFEWTAAQVTRPWDKDMDRVMEGEQHNTYDIEFYGPNTMTGSLYLGALKAAAEMAKAMGEHKAATLYRSLYEQGRKKYDQLLWNGRYYRQQVEVAEGLEVPEHLRMPSSQDAPSGGQPKYQYGEGCLSDQLLGQYLAHVVGLGYLLPPEHVRTAIKSVFDYNWRRPLGDLCNVRRVYALNDEAGLLLCSWPFGKRPLLPFVYSDEVWTGIEYQVAATLIYNGWIDEGLSVVKGARDRYDGLRRNPWEEIECGHHYARAMAS